MKSNVISLITVLAISTGLVACNKSSFQLREAKSDAEITKDVESQECVENCNPDYDVVEEETVVQPPTDYIPEPIKPTIQPPVLNDSKSCKYENELFGSVANITHGQDSQEILWNHFAPRGPEDYQVAYYQVVVMDAQMTAFKSKHLKLNQTSYLVKPSAISEDGVTTLSDKFTMKQGSWYWYKLIALDKDKKPVHIRKFDFLFSTHKGDFNRLVGFCSGY